jgi:hypothetical protein
VPIESNSLVSPPNDHTQRAWRYMDFAKFVALISRSELHLCNLEKLAKDDPHEGLLSAPNYRHREWKTIADLTAEERKTIFFRPMRGEEERIQFESTRNSREFWLRRRFYDRRALLANCWHLNDDESAAMWSQYASNGMGIAITSSYSRMIEALAGAPQYLVCGVVKYLDWTKEPVDNSFVFPFSKRMSFKHENELRILHWDQAVQEAINGPCNRLAAHMMDHLYRRISAPINWDLVRSEVESIPYKGGISVPVKLATLINEVYVSPNSPDWFLDVVARVSESFSLKLSPKRSDLLSSPIR